MNEISSDNAHSVTFNTIDPIDALEARGLLEAAARFRREVRRKDALRGALAPLIDERESLRIEIAKAREELRRAEELTRANSSLNEQQVESALGPRREAIARLEARMRRAREDIDIAAPRDQDQGRRVHNIEDAVRALPAGVKPFVAKANGAKRGTLQQTIASARKRLEEIEQAWETLRRAPASAAQRAQDAHEQVDEMAKRGALTITAGGKSAHRRLIFPVQRIQLDVIGGKDNAAQFAVGEQLDVAAFLAGLLPDLMHKAIDSALERDPRAGGLSDAERAEKFAALDAEKRELEHQEEEAITAAALDGAVIYGRPGADPLAILGLELPNPV